MKVGSRCPGCGCYMEVVLRLEGAGRYAPEDVACSACGRRYHVHVNKNDLIHFHPIPLNGPAR